MYKSKAIVTRHLKRVFPRLAMAPFSFLNEIYLLWVLNGSLFSFVVIGLDDYFAIKNLSIGNPADNTHIKLYFKKIVRNVEGSPDDTKSII